MDNNQKLDLELIAEHCPELVWKDDKGQLHLHTLLQYDVTPAIALAMQKLIRERDRKTKTLEVIDDIATQEGMTRSRIENADTDHPEVISDEVLDRIYRFAHVGTGRCKADHSDWEKELNDYMDADDTSFEGLLEEQGAKIIEVKEADNEHFDR